MGQALDVAYAWLKDHSKQARIILISDGEPNDTPKNMILQTVKENNTLPIDCIGVGTANTHSYDPDFLRKICNITGGIFTEIGTTEQLCHALVYLSPINRPMLGTVSKENDKQEGT